MLFALGLLKASLQMLYSSRSLLIRARGRREHELINILRRKSEWYDKGQISWILDSSFVVDFVVNPIPRQRL